MIVVDEPNSIIFCGFSTIQYDIQFGFYKVTSESEMSNEDETQHLDLEEIFQLSKIESYPNPVKVSFIAKEPGIYKIVWSNEHSWFKAKTLKYKISVLRPITQEEESKIRSMEGGSMSDDIYQLSSTNQLGKAMTDLSSINKSQDTTISSK